jgi:SAM-dependent methyltransferase
LHPFTDREAVESALRELAERELVAELERVPGQHDRRWMHLLGAEPVAPAEAAPPVDREVVLVDGPRVRDRRVAAEYDKLAASYAEILGDDLDDKLFDQWLLEQLAGNAPGQALDVGCGPGQVAAYLAQLDMEVTGLDLSPAMLAEARERHPELSFVQGSFDLPPMPRGSDPRDPGWGLVTAWYAFVHLAGSEIAPTIRSMAKVLCRGGYLALALHAGHEVVHPGTVVGVETDLDFVLHDHRAVVAAAQDAGLVDIEWYLRGPYAGEAQTERLYLTGRRPG